jgi:hypothetical protein
MKTLTLLGFSIAGAQRFRIFVRGQLPRKIPHSRSLRERFGEVMWLRGFQIAVIRNGLRRRRALKIVHLRGARKNTKNTLYGKSH